MPVIISRLGAKEYSVNLPPMATALFIVSLFDFGVTIGLPALWGMQRNKKVRQIYIISTLFIKIVSIIAAISLFYLISTVFLHYRNDLAIFGAALMIVGQLLNPVWLNIITQTTVVAQICNATGRISPIILIYFFLDSKNNPGIVNFYIGIGCTISTFALYVIMWAKFKKYIIINSKILIRSIKFSKLIINFNLNIYFSQLTQTAGRTALPMIAGLFLSPIQFLAYSITEKSIRACQSIQTYFMQYEYSLIIGSSIESGLRKKMIDIYFKKIFIVSSMLMVIFFTAYPIISYYIFVGDEEAISASSELYQYFSLLIVVGGVNYWLGALGLASIKKSNVLLIGSFFSAVSALFVAFFGGMNTNPIQYTAAMFISEIVLMLFVLNAYRKSN